jgi:hypothetical protein
LFVKDLGRYVSKVFSVVEFFQIERLPPKVILYKNQYTLRVLDKHENSSKENLNREPGYMNTIEYSIWLNMMIVRVSSLFFYNVERNLFVLF